MLRPMPIGEDRGSLSFAPPAAAPSFTLFLTHVLPPAELDKRDHGEQVVCWCVRDEQVSDRVKVVLVDAAR